MITRGALMFAPAVAWPAESIGGGRFGLSSTHLASNNGTRKIIERLAMRYCLNVSGAATARFGLAGNMTIRD